MCKFSLTNVYVNLERNIMGSQFDLKWYVVVVVVVMYSLVEQSVCKRLKCMLRGKLDLDLIEKEANKECCCLLGLLCDF